MKQGPNQKRHRGRSNGRRHQHGLSSNYESNGPEVKIKGSASQVQDRYQALARDAVASGDRVAAENYLQHAEHYQRIINGHLATAAANAANANPADSNGATRVNGGREQPDGRQRTDDARPRSDESRQRGDDGRSEERSGGRGRGRGRGRAPAAETVAPNAPQPDLAQDGGQAKVADTAKPAATGKPAATAKPSEAAKPSETAGEAAAKTKGEPDTSDNATA